MAKIDELLAHVADADLRRRLEAAVAELRQRKKFGLVFEQHLPETALLPASRIRTGSAVALRRRPPSAAVFVATAIDGDLATIADAEGDVRSVPISDLMVVKPFGEPVYPVLQCTDELLRAPGRPNHVLINGENFHVLQLLRFGFEEKVDCIYIDPPYNTGARDWKYNNSYVDRNDTWRHSKWLSFMEKRLRLAKHLLRPDDSVLVVTIDDNEAYSLGLLLDDLFPTCERQMISITVSPRGKSRVGRLSQIDEYAIVVYVGSAKVADLASNGGDVEVRWRYLRRNDIESARGTVKGGPRQFYPIYVDQELQRIVKIGDPLAPGDPLESAPNLAGAVAVFPINENGVHMNWGLTGTSLQRALDDGFVRVTPGAHPSQPYTFAYLTAPNIRKVTIGTYRIDGTRPDGSKIVVIPGGKTARPTTAWRETRHDAGAYGTGLLGDLIPGRKFPFPKSLYAVEDTLRLFLQDKPNALVLDFFAGSGTTAHAVARLNHQDDGDRTCISVTNNEVSEAEAKELNKRGIFFGDPEFEAQGICRAVTIPRLMAAFSGCKPDGQPVPGEYKWPEEFPMADGFEENLICFDLAYADPDEIDVGNHFGAIVPALWLTAEAKGPLLVAPVASEPWFILEGNPFAVLLDEDRFADFQICISKRPDLTHLWLVTDSEPAFTRMRSRLPHRFVVGMLYRDYLRNFRLNAELAR
jgi:adenine-specific DNA-methyltransferase